MATHKVGCFVGSLAIPSINRPLAKALVRLAPSELELSEIPNRNVPLYSYDYDADFPAPARAFKQAIAAVDAALFVTPRTTRRPRHAWPRPLGAQFGDNSHEAAPAGASEDFSVFGRTWNVPYEFWFVGGTDPALYEQAVRDRKLNSIPSNHSPKFAPVLKPTLATGLQAMLTAASVWLCPAVTH